MDIKYDVDFLGRALDVYMVKVRNKCISPAWDKGVVYADITNIMEFFKHLQIDENYKIIVCYEALDVIIAGKVFAVEKGNEVYGAGVNDRPGGFIHGQYSPLEVIFCDNTPEGYLEVAIFNSTMEELSCGHENPVKNFVCFDETIRKNPNPFIIKPDNWLPKYYVDSFGYKKLLTCEYDYLNGISLCEYIFAYGTRVEVMNYNRMYKSHVHEFNRRFSANKECCIFDKRQITIRDGNKALDIVY